MASSLRSRSLSSSSSDEDEEKTMIDHTISPKASSSSSSSQLKKEKKYVGIWKILAAMQDEKDSDKIGNSGMPTIDFVSNDGEIIKVHKFLLSRFPLSAKLLPMGVEEKKDHERVELPYNSLIVEALVFVLYHNGLYNVPSDEDWAEDYPGTTTNMLTLMSIGEKYGMKGMETHYYNTLANKVRVRGSHIPIMYQAASSYKNSGNADVATRFQSTCLEAALSWYVGAMDEPDRCWDAALPGERGRSQYLTHRLCCTHRFVDVLICTIMSMMNAVRRSSGGVIHFIAATTSVTPRVAQKHCLKVVPPENGKR